MPSSIRIDPSDLLFRCCGLGSGLVSLVIHTRKNWSPVGIELGRFENTRVATTCVCTTTHIGRLTAFAYFTVDKSRSHPIWSALASFMRSECIIHDKLVQKVLSKSQGLRHGISSSEHVPIGRIRYLLQVLKCLQHSNSNVHVTSDTTLI